MPTKKKARTPPGDIRLDPDDTIDRQPLGEEEKQLVRRAYDLFRMFQDKHRAAHEEMRTARRMRQLRQEERSWTSPASMTLNSCIDNVIADQIDNMPEAMLVPEKEDTAQSAEEMTDIVSYVLYQAGWPAKYKRLMEDAAVTGTGVAQVFWDEDLDDGKGMVNVIAWHPEDFYPDPQYENIQDGRACFKATTTTVAWIEEHYPDARGYVQGDDLRGMEEAPILTEVPEGDKLVTLLEFWYKRYDAGKRKYRVHMAQLAGRTLLYSTELGVGCNAAEYAEGVYAHGLYPFELFRYREVFRQPFGTGLVHDYKEQQNAIDRYAKYIDDNARQSSRQKIFIRQGSGINPEDVADMSKTVVEWNGHDIREVMQTIQANPLNGQVYNFMVHLIDTMKQDSGQNQFSRGEGGMGVTAASAINTLVTQGGKISRMHTFDFRDTFREMIEQVLWVLSEYMEPGRKFKIVGGWDSGMSMKDRVIELLAPPKEGDRLLKPAYSVRVEVRNHDPAWAERHDQLLMQAAQAAGQAGKPIPPDVYVSMMQSYPDKGRIVRMLKENGTQLDQIAELTQQLEQMNEMLVQKDKNIAGLERMLDTQGGGAASVQQAQGADYGAMMNALEEQDKTADKTADKTV